MKVYNPKEIEPRWQKYWLEKGIYKKYDKSKKFYALDMFPYPSGVGLHVGHPKGYIATDVVSRFKMLQGYSVLHPMGWDAFGLPAENYAIKTGIHPRVSVEKNVATFKKQLEMFGFTYDWDREINTTDPDYYKWTQWIFLKLFEKGLAYESDEPVNWCSSCKTVLANEDLEVGKCERCGTEVMQKKIRQWVLKMTEYADRLLEDLDRKDLDWEEQIKEQQRNWIGRSEGAIIKFPIVIPSEVEESKIRSSRRSAPQDDNCVEVFTTRVDTIYGCTYCVVAPEHYLIKNYKLRITNYEEVKKYIIQAQNKTELERMEEKDKTGVEIKGIKAINPFTNEEVPIFAADYVLGHYGTGAVMAVPAHDERDFEFAKKYNLPIRQSIAPHNLDESNPPRVGYENTVRKVVHVILENNKGEALTLNLKGEDWGNDKPKTLIIGGIEDGETPESAALREIKEETGYTDIEIIKIHPIEFHAEFFAAHKKVNRYVKTTGVFCRLKSEKQSLLAKEEKELHEIVWVKHDMLPNFVTIPDDIFLSKAYIENVDTYIDSGILINSEKFNGLKSEEAREKMTAWLKKEKIGEKKINYKMRDWVFSRQRYWGEPIPIIHCEKCGAVGVPEDKLPVILPELADYEPTETGEPPLSKATNWVNTNCPKCGGPGKRETNTMPQWAGSSWYYLRYIDPKNNQNLIGKQEEKKWMPVDLYVGGAEHATRHLLYARFWHKFLYDIGVVSTEEPFKKLVHVGLINGEDGRKMSKRWGNVINPDDVISEFGADAVRLYEMFMGPFTQNISWSTDGLKGTRRFLEKVYKLANKTIRELGANEKLIGANRNLENLLHKTIKKVTEDIKNFRFNTAISQMMILVNEMEKQEKLLVTDYQLLIAILSPFAPHISEELWSELGYSESIFEEKWPEYNTELVKDKEVEFVIQVNGKVRDRIKASVDLGEEEAKKLAMESQRVAQFTKEKKFIKIIFVPEKLINIVVK